jgi:hypothetical protein
MGTSNRYVDCRKDENRGNRILKYVLFVEAVNFTHLQFSGRNQYLCIVFYTNAEQPIMRVRRESLSQDPLKEATIAALKRVVDPLVELMFDAGITVAEFSRLVRERAVRSAASRIKSESGRSSKSRVAIITGLPRAEVARILNADDAFFSKRPDQHPARRVLAAWYNKQRFLAANGDPAVLPIFGKQKSFEQLVGIHSGGIPVRAMLDQLTQVDAVEILPGQRVKARSPVPIFKGMNTTAIANVGERTGDLLGTLKGNLRATSNPLFEGTALMNDIDIGAVPLVRREIAQQGAAFIDGATLLLSRSRAKPRRSKAEVPSQCRVGVTVYYFQDEIVNDAGVRAPTSHGARKNLQRRYSNSKMRRKKETLGKSSQGI